MQTCKTYKKKYKSKTLIILDWDDTLFPTSWTVKNSIDLTKTNIQNKYIVFFSKLDLLLYKLLIKLLKHGKVVVVTNAMIKWVMISSNILPNTQQLIKKKIKLVSARDKYQEKHPGDGFAWKRLIFRQLVWEYFMNKNYVQNIISVGDADYEFKALIDLYDFKKNENDNRYLKSIRLISSPTYDMLIDQLEVLNKSMKKIIEINNHMDLKFDDIS